MFVDSRVFFFGYIWCMLQPFLPVGASGLPSFLRVTFLHTVRSLSFLVNSCRLCGLCRRILQNSSSFILLYLSSLTSHCQSWKLDSLVWISCFLYCLNLQEGSVCLRVGQYLDKPETSSFFCEFDSLFLSEVSWGARSGPVVSHQWWTTPFSSSPSPSFPIHCREPAVSVQYPHHSCCLLTHNSLAARWPVLVVLRRFRQRGRLREAV